MRQWLNFETRISVRYGASAAHSSQVIANRSATGANAARSASRASASAVDGEPHPHEEPALGQVVELLALQDVAAVLDEQAADRVHDARPVGADAG